MMDLEISPDNRFVAAYTSNNQVNIAGRVEGGDGVDGSVPRNL